MLENGVTTWLASGHLRAFVLEVFDPSDRVDDRRERFDFTIEWEVTPLEQQEPVEVGKCPDGRRSRAIAKRGPNKRLPEGGGEPESLAA